MDPNGPLIDPKYTTDLPVASDSDTAIARVIDVTFLTDPSLGCAVKTFDVTCVNSGDYSTCSETHQGSNFNHWHTANLTLNLTSHEITVSYQVPGNIYNLIIDLLFKIYHYWMYYVIIDLLYYIILYYQVCGNRWT